MTMLKRIHTDKNMKNLKSVNKIVCTLLGTIVIYSIFLLVLLGSIYLFNETIGYEAIVLMMYGFIFYGLILIMIGSLLYELMLFILRLKKPIQKYLLSTFLGFLLGLTFTFYINPSLGYVNATQALLNGILGSILSNIYFGVRVLNENRVKNVK